MGNNGNINYHDYHRVDAIVIFCHTSLVRLPQAYCRLYVHMCLGQNSTGGKKSAEQPSVVFKGCSQVAATASQIFGFWMFLEGIDGTFMAHFSVFVLVFSLHQAGFNLMYSMFILIGVAGLSQLLYFLARRGFFRVSRWAEVQAIPPASVDISPYQSRKFNRIPHNFTQISIRIDSNVSFYQSMIFLIHQSIDPAFPFAFEVMRRPPAAWNETRRWDQGWWSRVAVGKYSYTSYIRLGLGLADFLDFCRILAAFFTIPSPRL